MVRNKNIQIPKEKNGFIPTLNNRGFMTSFLDPFSKEIIEFSKKAPGPFLDIGAAYGRACELALKLGSQVIANDIDKRHLNILMQNVKKEFKNRLSLKIGEFPDGIDFKENSIGAILICRVIHFFDGPTIIRGIQKATKWLVPSGKLCVVAETPFLGNWQRFQKIYEERKKRGVEWPGWVEDVPKYEDSGFANILPKQMHFVDIDMMKNIFEEAGLKIERLEYIDRYNFPPAIRFDGRESVGIIGVKL